MQRSALSATAAEEKPAGEVTAGVPKPASAAEASDRAKPWVATAFRTTHEMATLYDGALPLAAGFSSFAGQPSTTPVLVAEGSLEAMKRMASGTSAESDGAAEGGVPAGTVSLQWLPSVSEAQNAGAASLTLLGLVAGEGGVCKCVHRSVPKEELTKAQALLQGPDSASLEAAVLGLLGLEAAPREEAGDEAGEGEGEGEGASASPWVEDEKREHFLHFCHNLLSPDLGVHLVDSELAAWLAKH